VLHRYKRDFIFFQLSKLYASLKYESWPESHRELTVLNSLVMLYSFFFWVIPRRLNFICRQLRNTLFHLHRRHKLTEDGMECSKMSAHKIQTSGNHPKERIQHSEHGEILKSRTS